VEEVTLRFRGSVPSLFLALLVVGSAGGCKLVKNSADAGGGQDTEMVSSRPGGNMNVLVDEIWEVKVVPQLRDHGTDMATLAPAIASDLQAAGEAHGYRPSSEGSPWNFATSVKGRIVAAKTDTRAATADVDVDGDGKADAILQLGPLIRGTAMRDVLPFIDFTSFTDQIEFAHLSRALNTKAYETALKDLPRENLVGRDIEAFGAFTMRGQGDKLLVTPVQVTLSAQ
jgi:predicted lipoprotein